MTTLVSSLFADAGGEWRGELDRSKANQLTQNSGVLPSQWIRRLIDRGQINASTTIEPSQIQPSSLDLRLGRIAYRVQTSFLPGKDVPVLAGTADIRSHAISLEGGAILEKGGVYLIEIEECLKLPSSISAAANPKSSTGRLDVFTRLIADGTDVFDTVPSGYNGRLWAEVSPRTFSIRVRRGTRLNQIRFRRRNSQHSKHHTFRLTDNQLIALNEKMPLVDGDAIIRDGLNLRVNLLGEENSNIIGYKAKKHTGFIDMDIVNHYEPKKYWDPIYYDDADSIILEPSDFYILASKERVHIPAKYAAEMVALDPLMGEFRVHYAGFFDPGFGERSAGGAGSKAVLEVRTYDIPFYLKDGQTIGRLMFENLTEAPNTAYGGGIGSNYQGQGLKLSKHFKTG